MPQIKFTTAASGLGISVSQDATFTNDNGPNFSATLAAAKTGVLTLRSDANTGTLTMTTGHGITTGQIIDLYWSGGCARSFTVGTVSVDSVPIDLGLGDALPDQDTAITAMVQDVETSGWTLTGSNVTGIMCGSAAPFTVVFKDGSDVEKAAFSAYQSSGGCCIWNTDMVRNGYANPLSGDSPTKITVTQGSTSSAVVSAAVIAS